MTKSRKRNVTTALSVPGYGEGMSERLRTGSRFERRGKSTGCRMTNDCKHRKGSSTVVADRVEFSLGEPLFDGRSLELVVKQVGTSSYRRDGVKGGDTYGRFGESNWGDPWLFCSATAEQIGEGIRRNAESPGRCGQRESETAIVVRTGRDNRTRRERRAVRLRALSARRMDRR
jgi:hypothetical protein